MRTRLRSRRLQVISALERIMRARGTRSLSPRVSPSRVPLALVPRTFKRRLRWLGDALIRIFS